MRKFYYWKSFILLTAVTFIFACNVIDAAAARLKTSIDTPLFEEVPVSGPVNSVPWEHDEEFFEACSKNGVGVMMAAFRTVLRDPLPGEEYNVHLAAGRLAGIVLKPGQVFSQNSAIGPYTTERGFQKGPTYIGTKLTTTIGGGVCKIASTLYNVTALCNLEIVERHAHSMPVPYVPYGQDATVAFGARDFSFRNNTSSPLMIWAEGVDNILYMAFYGTELAPAVEWRHEVLEVRKAPVNVNINQSLKPGEEKVILEGMDGAVVKSWLLVKGENWTKTRYMGVSDYRPMPYIVERDR